MRIAPLILLTTAAAYAASSHQSGEVRLMRAPNNGIQPQAAADEHGDIHLIYFSGDAMAGDLFYVRSNDGGSTFSAPLKVNTTPGAAIAVGNIRGAHIAVGKNGRVHVAWNGSKNTSPDGSNRATPMLYTRLDDSGKAFERERNAITRAYGLDGGGSLAADQNGNVYVFWHAPSPGSEGEANRRVWVARSRDDGKTFAPEVAASEKPTGACGCCGMAAFADPSGDIFALYRSATETVHRDMYLLASRDQGRTFSDSKVDAWQVGYCVMSSASFASGAGSTFAAWETKGQIYFGRIDPQTGTIPHIAPASCEIAGRKHPALAGNEKGEVLLAWTEGMGWKKGGAVAWQVYDAGGNPTGAAGRADGVPAWSLITAFSRPDGGFSIVY